MRLFLLFLLLTFSLAAMAQQAEEESTAVETQNEQGAEVQTDEEAESASEDDEQSAPSDVDFKPDEEISEDYPVPLPSDI